MRAYNFTVDSFPGSPQAFERSERVEGLIGFPTLASRVLNRIIAYDSLTNIVPFLECRY